ncbi:acetylornithine transaminase [Myceligenerans pegani]|uniref:Acetylornithine transaminase n=1 Tax=Myceligenerans pegani TaxID=2776917 RepID=A0ABR9MYP8_9MICO|nr:acetylornithine transaminase [Myceligenerans sp. TRM 65318]MBE1876508.1 acetylornithine transaminase [Myceligenerans sp. TRM 65318]MBE3018779.1 acetylornithine transaminase [Myceligenerans sp. TRM 65318]
MNDLTTAGVVSRAAAGGSRGAVAPGEATGAAWTERYTGAVMDTFGPPQRVLVRGEGAYVWDADGKRYLDLLAGIAVNALGHAHPTLTAAISAQLGTLGHTSNFFGTPAQISLAERLLALAGAPPGSRVFFTNSGTEALEAAFKMTRRVPVSPGGVPGEVSSGARGGRCRTRVLALEGAFHGRSMGALALTYKPAYREPFEPLPGGVEHLPFGDAAALEEAFSPEVVAERGEVAAFVAEPLQGEAGVRPLPPGYLALARRLTREHGALLILDEVQTGIGRTGEWFAFQHPGVLGPAGAAGAAGSAGVAVAAGADVLPDVVTLAKGLGGGFPVGAVIAFGEEPARLLGRGQHGSTFGGNPVAAAAALATLGVIERDGLLAQVRATGDLLRAAIEGSGNPLITGVRGRGLLLAVQLAAPVAPRVVARALEAGFIVNAVAPDAVRLAPPLILTADQAREAAAFFAGLPASLAEHAAEPHTAEPIAAEAVEEHTEETP